MTPRYDMLLELAAHLKKPPRERAHRTFNFDAVNGFDLQEPTELGLRTPYCGTVGCAMGETPALWPELIQFHRDKTYCFVIDGKEHLFDSAAAQLFGIYLLDAYALFCPHQPRFWAEGRLSSYATASQVAESIRAYVAYMERHPAPGTKESK